MQVGPQGGCPRRSEKRDAGEGRRRGEDPSLCWVPPMSGNSAFHMGLPWARELPSKASPCASLMLFSEQVLAVSWTSGLQPC